MPKPTIDQIRAIGDFASTFRWDLQFAAFPAIGIYPPSELLNHRCISSTIPKATVQKTSTTVRGHTVHQPGKLQYESQLTLNFVEDVSNTVHTFFTQWREACVNSRTGAAGNKAEVEGIILLTRLNNQDLPVWVYKLTGVFLEDVTLPELNNGESPETMQIGIVLSYDYFTDNSI